MRPNALKTAEHAVSRLEAGFDRQKLLLKRPASIRHNLSSSLPLRLTVGLDDLAGGNGVTREVLCTSKKGIEKTQSQKMDQMAGSKQRDEEEGGLPSTKSSIWP